MDLTISVLLIVVAAFIGFFIGKVTSKNTKNSDADKIKIAQLETQFQQYKDNVEQHFSTSAGLMANMAQEYTKVYKQMANAQQQLLPESEIALNIPFKDDQEAPKAQEAINDVELDPKKSTSSTPDSAQPNDYVHGTHNIITPKAPDNETKVAATS